MASAWLYTAVQRPHDDPLGIVPIASAVDILMPRVVRGAYLNSVATGSSV